ncbi:hypothetical protein N7463_001689 [Penicillium fimorum]|uniref:Uncharacterized protein n=1 Tax=Penicillium fimorum TaxID=1882269 RepID=A0A9W9XXU4_9EURO|nr:hypothetical protein N7463_001689 [Penicillium fimorum]
MHIGGLLAYTPNGDMATELEAIARHYKKLNQLGVQLELQLELHLCPGHSEVPGNVAADAFAKKTQNRLFMQTAMAWSTAKSMKAALGPSSVPGCAFFVSNHPSPAPASGMSS